MPRSLRATRAGWCFVAIVFGVGFAALNTGNNLLYLVLALMLSFLVLSGILSEFALRGMRVERHLPRECFARRDNRVVLRLSNHQKRFPAFAISAEDHFGDPSDPQVAGRAFTLRIGPEDKADRSYAFRPERRGEDQFLSCRLSTRFPFGLFVKSADFELEEKFLVYPELLDAYEGSVVEHPLIDGVAEAGLGRSGDDLAGLRDYVRGDPMSRLHWPSSIRTGRLIVGEREGTPDAELDVLLELPEGLPGEETERRISAAASAVVAHLAEGKRVGLQTPSYRFTPESGLGHRAAILEFLATTGSPATGSRP